MKLGSFSSGSERIRRDGPGPTPTQPADDARQHARAGRAGRVIPASCVNHAYRHSALIDLSS